MTTDYRVADGVGWVEFAGDKLASVSTDTGTRSRWTELLLYRMVDGRYLLHSIGRTLVFHKAEGGCRKGTPAVLSSLSDDMVACEFCWPDDDPDALPDDDAMVRAEHDRPFAVICDDARGVVHALQERYRKVAKPAQEGGDRPAGHLSGPSVQLLTDASRVDPGIAALLGQVTRITP